MLTPGKPWAAVRAPQHTDPRRADDALGLFSLPHPPNPHLAIRLHTFLPHFTRVIPKGLSSQSTSQTTCEAHARAPGPRAVAEKPAAPGCTKDEADTQAAHTCTSHINQLPAGEATFCTGSIGGSRVLCSSDGTCLVNRTSPGSTYEELEQACC